MKWVFLPGLHGTAPLFEPVRPWIPKEVDPVFLSYPGAPIGSYDELLPIVQAAIADDEPFIAIGESFSGPLALMLSARPTPNLKAVVLAGSFATAPPLARLMRPVSRFLFHFRPLGFVLRHFFLGHDASPELLALFRRSLEGVPAAALQSRLELIIGLNIHEAAPRIQIPVLCLRATRDRAVPASAATAVQRMLPHTQVVDIDSPHLLLQRRPEQCIRAIENFLATVNA